MRVTEKKREANRRNALRSSGPKTAQGKSIAKWNAVKHGLLSREAVIPVGEGQERRSDFQALLARLRRDLRPRRALEQMLVEKIAVGYWRLRRVLRCETGEIRKGLESASREESNRQARQFELTTLAAQAGSIRAQTGIRNSSWGILYLIRILEQAKQGQ